MFYVIFILGFVDSIESIKSFWFQFQSEFHEVFGWGLPRVRSSINKFKLQRTIQSPLSKQTTLYTKHKVKQSVQNSFMAKLWMFVFWQFIQETAKTVIRPSCVLHHPSSSLYHHSSSTNPPWLIINNPSSALIYCAKIDHGVRCQVPVVIWSREGVRCSTFSMFCT